MCTNVDDRIVANRNALFTALGDKTSKYMNSLNSWFRHMCTEEEFDIEVRKLLSYENVHLHNQFFSAVLNKIDVNRFPQCERTTMSMHYNSCLLGKKRKRSSRNEHAQFEPLDFTDFKVEDNLELIRPACGTDVNGKMLPTQRYCVQELFLPDSGFILGRFLIGAWEVGLVNVEDSVADYVSIAVQVLLKNLVSAIIMKRKHYKVTGEGSFYYDIGSMLRDPTVRNTLTRQKIDDGPLELDKEITSPNFMRRSNEEGTFLAACENGSQNPYTITLKDARAAMKDRNLIHSHSVYSLNMEKLTQMLH